MRHIFLIQLIFVAFTTYSFAQEGNIQLPKPQKSIGVDIMTAFEKRQSAKLTDFTKEDISLQELSNILWAGNGINREESGKRTAPSALNSQEIDIYVCRKDGIYLYLADRHELQQINTLDIRNFINSKQHTEASTILLLTANMERYRGYKKGEANSNGRIVQMSGVDAGIVSQNISLMCASLGIKTRPRASMQHEEILKSINPIHDTVIWLNMPISK